MAQWVASTHSQLGYAEQWDEVTGPLRWYRAWQQNAYLYCFVIEDAEAAKQYEDLDDDQWDWKPATSWSADWPHREALWDDALTQEPPAQVATQPAVVESAEEPAPQPAMEGTRLADPTVASSATPEYAPKGSYVWSASMTVTDVQTDRWSWIIQKVSVDDGETDATFWEAFPVAPGQAAAENEDVYQGGPSGLSGGTIRVVGLMQHHVFTESLPPGMDYGGSALSDSQQVASDSKPAFWLADDGTPHNLTFEWTNGTGANTLVSFATVPATGNPVFKTHHSQLSHG